jgi:rSAM/selenodomain-associated transferase 1
MKNNKDQCLLFFVKYPQNGKVKSRLQDSLASEKIIELYKHFVMDILTTIQSINIPFIICFYPPDKESSVMNWLGSHYSYQKQQGIDIGERMKDSFKKTFSQGYQKVVLIGSDIPDLPSEILISAFSLLNKYDVVLGPSEDGGYYLIGFTNTGFSPQIFHNISWNTNLVFEQTINIVKEQEGQVHLLPTWNDIDTISDLKKMYNKHKTSEFSHSETMKYILKNKIFP